MTNFRIDISQRVIPPDTIDPTTVKPTMATGKAFEDAPLDPFPLLQARYENIVRSMGAKTFVQAFKKIEESNKKIRNQAKALKPEDSVQDFMFQQNAEQTAMIKELHNSLIGPANTLLATVRQTLNALGKAKGMDPKEKMEKIAHLEELKKSLVEREKETEEYVNTLLDQVPTNVSEATRKGMDQSFGDRLKKQFDIVKKEEDRIVETYTKGLVDTRAKEKAFKAAEGYIKNKGSKEVAEGKMTESRMKQYAKAVYDRVYNKVKASGVSPDITREEIIDRFREQGAFTDLDFLSPGSGRGGWIPPTRGNVGLGVPPPPKGPNNGGVMSIFAEVQSVSTILQEIVQTFVNVRDIFITPLRTTLDMGVLASKGQLTGSSAIGTSSEGLAKMTHSGLSAGGSIAGGLLGAARVAGPDAVGKFIAKGLGSTAGGLVGRGLGAALGGMGAGAAAGTAAIPIPIVGTLIGAAVGAAGGRAIGGGIADLTGIGEGGKMISLLTEIAENTSEQIKAFSPDVLEAKLGRQLQQLSDNIAIANRYGSSMGNIENSSAQLQSAMYKTAVKTTALLEEILVGVLDFLTFLVSIVNVIVEMLTWVKWIAERINIAWWIYQLLKNAIDKLLGKKSRIDVGMTEEDFMKNRPPGI